MPEIPLIPPIPYLRLTNDTQITSDYAPTILNTNERRFAEIILSLTLQSVFAYHEPGKVSPPPDKKCKSYTIPDFLVLAGMHAFLIEVGEQPRTTTGKLKGGKAAQRRTLHKTGLPVGVLGTPELDQLEKLISKKSEMKALMLLISFTGNNLQPAHVSNISTA